MALYSYVRTKRSRSLVPRISALLSLTLISCGVLLLLWILYPIVTFELFYSTKFSSIIRPVPNDSIAQTITKDISVVLASSTLDYTKASTWFPQAAAVTTSISNNGYTLSIPKLKIENATVTIGGDDLSKSLVHFTGPLPGNFGNTVILGHSTLPFLYNPKDYKSIFTRLITLTPGDRITVTTDNVTYTYSIEDLKIVRPDDLSVLMQSYATSSLTLITCVPPGTYLKRLVILASLL